MILNFSSLFHTFLSMFSIMFLGFFEPCLLNNILIVSCIFLDACTSVTTLTFEETLNYSCDDKPDFVTSPLEGFSEILERIFGIRSRIILLVHVAFYVSNLMLIEMIKTDSQQDDLLLMMSLIC